MNLYSQRGVVLVTALLVILLAVMIITAMTTRQQFDINRTAHFLNTDQAYIYALSAENWARRVLARDRNAYDNLREKWALQLPPTIVEGGTLQGSLIDLQGRFNLNNVIDSSNQPRLAEIERLQRLLRALELSTDWVYPLIDWLDTDLNPQFYGGAEDLTYLVAQPPYRAANTLLRSTGELVFLAHFDPKTLPLLSPYLTALPEPTLINVNTASAPVLMSAAEDLSLSQAEKLVETAKNKGFETLEEFLRHEALAGVKIDHAALTVSSRYFLLTARVEIGGSVVELTSILARREDGITVILRSLGG